MSLLLKQIYDFFKMLNSETGTAQIASGLSLGIILGFSPFFSLQTFLVLLIILFFRVQMGAAFVSAFFFKLMAFIVDPLSDSLGRVILESEILRPVWTTLYNAPLVPLTRFNNSIVMGSAVVGFILAVPAFFMFASLIHHYRMRILNHLKTTKLWKWLRATALYQWYMKYEDLYG